MFINEALAGLSAQQLSNVILANLKLSQALPTGKTEEQKEMT